MSRSGAYPRREREDSMIHATKSFPRWAGAALLATLATTLGLPERALAATPCANADTGVVRVSSDVGTAEGEEPLAVNPVTPREMTAVANVFQPVPPLSIQQDPLYGG